MDHRLGQQPLSHEQMAAILRQRADRLVEGVAMLPQRQQGQGGDIMPPLVGARPRIRARPGIAAAPGDDPRGENHQPRPVVIGPAQQQMRVMLGIGPAGLGGPMMARPPMAAAEARGIPIPLYRQASISSPYSDEEERPIRSSNVSVDGDVISYARESSGGRKSSSGSGNDEKPQIIPPEKGKDPPEPQQKSKKNPLGVYVDGKPVMESGQFFEVEILDKNSTPDPPNIVIGLVCKNHSMDIQPGWASRSIGFSTSDGNIYRGRPRGLAFGPVCEVGDRVGCGIRPVQVRDPNAPFQTNVFITHNGKEIGGNSTMNFPIPPGGLFPAVSLSQPGEEVLIRTGLQWNPEEDMMLVDGGEEEWLRLHDIQINGQVLEYTGRGKALIDVGLAQAKTPIGTRNHYFEIEIVDPGASCYIAIGLARRDYPKNRHPGWNKGSIAYHADDGKVFVGSGTGAPFGPRCHKGDVMGCGVLFPRNYECKSDSEEEIEQQGGGQNGQQLGQGWNDGLGGAGLGIGGLRDGRRDGGGGVVIDHDYVQIDEFGSDSADEDEWWNDQVFVQSGVQVQIYFTRNGKVIGTKDVRIPKGGFFPTVGMMSSQEKVRVDLHPLSG